MTKLVFAMAAAVAALTFPAMALAYVGPGAGLSLLGALWALVIAVGTALVFVVAWPLRRMLRRRRAERSANATQEPPQDQPSRTQAAHHQS